MRRLFAARVLAALALTWSVVVSSPTVAAAQLRGPTVDEVILATPPPVDGMVLGSLKGGASPAVVQAGLGWASDYGDQSGTVWIALSPDDRQAWADMVMDELVAAFPDHPRYSLFVGAVAVDPQTFKPLQTALARVQQDPDGNRSYFGF